MVRSAGRTEVIVAEADQVEQGWMLGKTFKLRVDVPTASEFLGTHGSQGPNMKPTPYKKGDVVKVVMVSRFGDCGITTDLTKERGYATRVSPMDLEPLQPIPANVCPKCHLEKGHMNHPTGNEECPAWVKEQSRQNG